LSLLMSLASLLFHSCGDKGNRTPNLFHAMEARYQLRHIPFFVLKNFTWPLAIEILTLKNPIAVSAAGINFTALNQV
jgi:hypothetical protein